jgi:hypothetical protein
MKSNSIALLLLLAPSLSFSANPNDFVEVLYGESNRTYKHEEITLAVSKEVAKDLLVRFELERSEELDGGFDNNAVISNHKFLEVTHLFDSTNNVTPYIAIGYTSSEIHNKATGTRPSGSRYTNANVTTKGLALGLRSDFNGFSTDVDVRRSEASTDIYLTSYTAGLSYNLSDTLQLRTKIRRVEGAISYNQAQLGLRYLY